MVGSRIWEDRFLDKESHRQGPAGSRGKGTDLVPCLYKVCVQTQTRGQSTGGPDSKQGHTGHVRTEPRGAIPLPSGWPGSFLKPTGDRGCLGTNTISKKEQGLLVSADPAGKLECPLPGGPAGTHKPDQSRARTSKGIKRNLGVVTV